MKSSTGTRWARVHIVMGRVFYTLALLAVIGAWITQVTGRPILGMSQQHLYNDAIVLALLGVGAFLDAFWHAQSRT